MRYRGADVERLGVLLERDRDLKVQFHGAPISPRDWESAVGSRIAARARPTRLEKGVLYVRAATSTWSQELTLLSSVIIEQLRGRGVPVTALRFHVGPIDKPSRKPYREDVRTSPPSVELPELIKRELTMVSDPDLRETIERAAAKNLGWQLQRSEALKKEKRHADPLEPGVRKKPQET